MSEIEKNARKYLSSHSVNWQLGLDILEALVMSRGDRTLATQVLQSLMEDLRLNNWTQVTTLQAAANNGVSGNVTIDSSFTGYSTTAAAMLSDFVCTRTISDVAGQTNMKLLTLNVAWVGYNGGSRAISFSSYYGKSGLYDYFYTTH